MASCSSACAAGFIGSYNNGGWKGSREVLVQPCAPSRVSYELRSDQVAQDFIQSCLQSLQGRRLPKLSEKPVPLFPLDPVFLLTQKAC